MPLTGPTDDVTGATVPLVLTIVVGEDVLVAGVVLEIVDIQSILEYGRCAMRPVCGRHEAASDGIGRAQVWLEFGVLPTGQVGQALGSSETFPRQVHRALTNGSGDPREHAPPLADFRLPHQTQRGIPGPIHPLPQP